MLGGIDSTGPHLYTIHPHGSTDKLPYVTMGSGSLAAMAVFEQAWTPKMTREAAIELVCEAIEAGIWNDLGSGSNVDVCIIEPHGTENLRNYRTPNEKGVKAKSYKWRRCVRVAASELCFCIADTLAHSRRVFLTGASRHGPRRVRLPLRQIAKTGC